MTNLIGQINRQQLITTLKWATITATASALVVINSNLPKIVDVASPIGIFLLTAVPLAIRYLNSGEPIAPAQTPAK